MPTRCSSCTNVKVPVPIGFPIFYALVCKADLNYLSWNVCNGELYGALYGDTTLPGCTLVKLLVYDAACPSPTTSKKGKPTKRA